MRTDALDRAANDRILDAARRFTLRLSGAVSSLKTFPLEHPSLQFSYRGIAEAATEIVDLVGTAQIAPAMDSVRVGELVAELDPTQHEHLKGLMAWLRARDITAFRVDERVTQEQVQAILAVLVMVEDLEPVQAREEANKALAAKGLSHFRLEAAVAQAAQETGRRRSDEPARLLLEVYLELALLSEDLVVNGPRSGTLAALEDLVPTLVDVVLPRTQAVRTLIELGQGIPYETRHAAHTTLLAVAVGARLGLGREALVDLGLAVATMDLGMRVLPPEVRNASRELLPGEVVTLRMHPLESVRAHLLSRGMDVSLRRRLLVAFEQHLGLQRDGYPRVHRWPAQHLYSRIASVCDAYDALSSTTAWRKGFTPEQALAQLRPPTDQSHDPLIVAELCAVLGTFPPQCRVRLSDGAVGTVLRPRGEGGLPVIRLDGEQGETALGQRGPDGALVRTITEVMLTDVGA